MRPIGLPILVFSFFLFPPFSFASRQEIISNTLAQVEEVRSQQNEVYEDSSSRISSIPRVIPRETKKTVQDSLDTFNKLSSASETKKKALEYALYLSAGSDINLIHYSEWSGGVKKDEDFGRHNGFYFNIGYKSNRYSETFMGKPFIEGYYRSYDDVIKYKGGWFDAYGNEGPFNCNQKSEIRRWGLKVGSSRDILDAGEIFGYFDFGERVWNRGENELIDFVNMYKEKYYWSYYGLGVGINYKVLPKLSLGFEWTGWLTIKPKMHAYDFGGLDFKLGQVWGYEVKMPIKYFLLKNLSIDVTPYYTYWHINKSDVVVPPDYPIPLIEPDSNTHEEGLLGGLTYIF